MAVGESIRHTEYIDNTPAIRALAQTNAALVKSVSSMAGTMNKQYGKMNNQLKAHVKTSTRAAEQIKDSWWKRFGTVALGFTIAYRAMNALENGLRRVVTVIGDAIRESGELASLQAKLALWTTMYSKSTITYADAFIYARGTMLELMKASVTSLSSIEELSTGLDEIGQTLGLVRTESVKAAVDLIDFTVMVAQTTGSTTRQIRQEIQALLQGQVRTTDIVIRTMRKMGVITDENIANLKKQIDVQETFDKVLVAISEHMEEYRKIVLRTDVIKAMTYWEKSIRVVLVESIMLASALEDAGNIFAEVFATNAEKFRKSMTTADWKRQIRLMTTFRNVLQKLVNAFEWVVLSIGKIIAVFTSLEDKLMSLSKEFRVLMGVVAGVVIINVATTAYKVFGGILIWLVATPIKALMFSLNSLYLKILLIPIVVAAAGIAVVALKDTFDELGKSTETFLQKANKVAGGMSSALALVAKAAQEAVEEVRNVDVYQLGRGKLSDVDHFLRAFNQKLKGLFDGVEKSGEVFVDKFGNRVKSLGEVISKVLTPILKNLQKDFKSLMTAEDVDLITARVKMLATNLKLELMQRAQEDTAALKKYEEELEDLKITSEALRRTITAVRRGFITPDEISRFQKKMKVFLDAEKVPEKIRDAWLEAHLAIFKNKDALDVLTDAYKKFKKDGVAALKAIKKEVKDLAKVLEDQDKVQRDLAELRGTEHERAIAALNKEFDERLKLAHGDIDLIKEVGDRRKEGLDKLKNQYEIWGRSMINLSQRTAEAIEQSFSDFWFDVFIGKLKSLADIIEGFLNSVLRAVSDVMGQMTAELLIGRQGTSGSLEGGLIQGIGKLIGNIGSSQVPHIAAYQHGGILHEPIIGKGLRSGSLYAFAEHGPERISPIGGGGGASVNNIIIQNNTGQPSQESRRPNNQGGEDFLIAIGESFVNDIRNIGPIHRQFRQTFGVAPVVQGR